MKTRIYLATLLMSAAALFAGCSDDDKVQADPDPNVQQLELTSVETTASSFTVDVKAKDAEMPYICVNVSKKVIDRVERAHLAEYIMDDMRRVAREEGVSFNEYLRKYLRRGSQTVKVENLLPGSTYEMVAFGVGSENRIADNISYLYFRTLNADNTGCTFTVDKAGETQTGMKLEVVPSIRELPYYFVCIAKADYDSFKDTLTDAEMLALLFNDEYNERLLRLADEWGYITQDDIEQVISEIFKHGTVTVDMEGAVPGLEVKWLAASYARVTTEEGDRLVISSDVSSGDIVNTYKGSSSRTAPFDYGARNVLRGNRLSCFSPVYNFLQK